MSSDLTGDRVSGRVAGLGEFVLHLLDRCGAFAILAGQTVRAGARPRFPALETLRQMDCCAYPVGPTSVERRSRFLATIEKDKETRRE